MRTERVVMLLVTGLLWAFALWTWAWLLTAPFVINDGPWWPIVPILGPVAVLMTALAVEVTRYPWRESP